MGKKSLHSADHYLHAAREAPSGRSDAVAHARLELSRAEEAKAAKSRAASTFAEYTLARLLAAKPTSKPKDAGDERAAVIAFGATQAVYNASTPLCRLSLNCRLFGGATRAELQKQGAQFVAGAGTRDDQVELVAGIVAALRQMYRSALAPRDNEPPCKLNYPARGIECLEYLAGLAPGQAKVDVKDARGVREGDRIVAANLVDSEINRDIDYGFAVYQNAHGDIRRFDEVGFVANVLALQMWAYGLLGCKPASGADDFAKFVVQFVCQNCPDMDLAAYKAKLNSCFTGRSAWVNGAITSVRSYLKYNAPLTGDAELARDLCGSVVPEHWEDTKVKVSAVAEPETVHCPPVHRRRLWADESDDDEYAEIARKAVLEAKYRKHVNAARRVVAAVEEGLDSPLIPSTSTQESGASSDNSSRRTRRSKRGGRAVREATHSQSSTATHNENPADAQVTVDACKVNTVVPKVAPSLNATTQLGAGRTALLRVALGKAFTMVAGSEAVVLLHHPSWEDVCLVEHTWQQLAQGLDASPAKHLRVLRDDQTVYKQPPLYSLPPWALDSSELPARRVLLLPNGLGAAGANVLAAEYENVLSVELCLGTNPDGPVRFPQSAPEILVTRKTSAAGHKYLVLQTLAVAESPKVLVDRTGDLAQSPVTLAGKPHDVFMMDCWHEKANHQTGRKLAPVLCLYLLTPTTGLHFPVDITPPVVDTGAAAVTAVLAGASLWSKTPVQAVQHLSAAVTKTCGSRNARLVEELIDQEAEYTNQMSRLVSKFATVQSNVRAFSNYDKPVAEQLVVGARQVFNEAGQQQAHTALLWARRNTFGTLLTWLLVAIVDYAKAICKAGSLALVWWLVVYWLLPQVRGAPNDPSRGRSARSQMDRCVAQCYDYYDGELSLRQCEKICSDMRDTQHQVMTSVARATNPASAHTHSGSKFKYDFELVVTSERGKTKKTGIADAAPKATDSNGPEWFDSYLRGEKPRMAYQAPQRVQPHPEMPAWLAVLAWLYECFWQLVAAVRVMASGSDNPCRFFESIQAGYCVVSPALQVQPTWLAVVACCLSAAWLVLGVGPPPRREKQVLSANGTTWKSVRALRDGVYRLDQPCTDPMCLGLPEQLTHAPEHAILIPQMAASCITNGSKPTLCGITAAPCFSIARCHHNVVNALCNRHVVDRSPPHSVWTCGEECPAICLRRRLATVDITPLITVDQVKVNHWKPRLGEYTCSHGNLRARCLKCVMSHVPYPTFCKHVIANSEELSRMLLEEICGADEAWVARLTATRANQLQEATLYSAAVARLVKAFTKTEASVAPPTKARLIQGYGDESAQAEHAVLTYAIQQVAKKWFSNREVEGRQYTFGSGLSPEAIADWPTQASNYVAATECDDRCGCYCHCPAIASDHVRCQCNLEEQFVEVDFSNFDAHNSAAHFWASYVFYYAAIRHLHVTMRRAYLQFVVDCFDVTTCFNNGYGSVLARVYGTTKSGHNDTTLGNTLRSIAMYMEVNPECSYGSATICAGDDGLTIARGRHSCYVTEFGLHGMKAKMRSWDSLIEASFLSGLWAEVGDELVFVSKPGRMLVKQFWSHPPPPDVASWRATVARGVYPGARLVPGLREFVLKHWEDGLPESKAAVAKLRWSPMTTEWPYPDDAAADWFYRRYALSPADVAEFCALLASAEIGDMVVCKYTRALVERDLNDPADVDEVPPDDPDEGLPWWVL